MSSPCLPPSFLSLPPSFLLFLHPSLRLAFGFCAVCLISALSFGYFISVAGVMGRACGPQNNFSLIVKHVIDDQSTWKGEYPLGRVILQNPSYPLTVQLLLDSCRRNESLFMALHLAHRHNLEESVALGAAQRVNTACCLYSDPPPAFHLMLTLG